MEKLKPILAQKFWIFFGIVLILPVVGYFMTTGELAAQIKTRMESLESTFKGIPSGADSPNDAWAKGLQLLNDQQALDNRLANEELWRDQKEKLRWPDDIAAVMNKAEYFKSVLPEQGGSDLGFKYQDDYPREIRRLWEIVDPLDDGKNLRDSDKRRKVAFLMSDIHQTNTARWADLPPTHGDMWECQEDIWLQTELLQAIARVNANSISQGDAFVKQLGKILLFGATKAVPGAGAGASAGGGSSAGGDGGGFGGMMGGMGGGMGGGGLQNKSAVSADINIAEEFTIIPDPTVFTGTGVGGAGGGGSGGMMAKGMGESSAGSPAQSPGGTTGSNKRYIDEDEKQPYKRRGFSIKVIMDHTKVPDLIAELMNSPFPVEIVRVQQVWLSDSSTLSGGGGASPYGGSGTGGFGGLNPAGSGDTTGGGAAIADDPNSGIGAFTRPGASGTASQSAMSDPNLAHVAILGVWTLYRPPAPAADAGQSAPATAAPMPDVAAAPPAATQPTDATAAETKPATAETTEATSDEPKKPDNSETPKSEPAKPENKESDQEKATDKDKPAEKSPATQEPSEKPTTEPKS